MNTVIVIGGDAAGASAASALKRALGEDVHVLILERQKWTSYAACGIPFWVAGDIGSAAALVARSPEKHRANGLDVRTRTEVTAIDTTARAVTARALGNGALEVYAYDHLVIATGAEPRRPPVPGLDLPGVVGVQTLEDGAAAIDALEGARRAVVVGAGYIGLEMAEAMCARGLKVTIIDQADQPMVTFDPDMGALIAEAMSSFGVSYHGGEPVVAVEAGPNGRAAAVVTDAGRYEADIVVLGLGVRPRADLAVAAGLPVGEHGGILTDENMRVLGHENIWSGGDCVEVMDRISGRRRHVALGTHANKHGRVIGANVAAVLGGHAPALTFPGVVGTAISRLCDLEVSRTGLREAEARSLGFDVVTAHVKSGTRAHYFPESKLLHVKVVAERGTGRLLGFQIVGGAASGKRIDAAATAIWAGMTAEDVTSLDLGYAPPFSPVWDPIQVAARKVAGLV